MTARDLLAIAACATLASVACSKEAPEEVESETVVTVSAMPARVGNITAVVRVAGIVTAAPGAELTVIAPEAARIVEMPRAEGDPVKRGDLLVRFEIPTTAAEVPKQRAEIARAQARLENAQAARTRARDLFDRGVAARKEVEDAVREVADAEADLAAAEAGAAAADTVAARSVVHATFDGIVARRSHNPGDLVEPTASDAVLRIVDPRRLEVTAQVPVGEAPRIHLGAPARIADARPDVSLPLLKVVSYPGAVQPGTTTVPLRLAFRSPAPYPVGAPVSLEIDAESHRGVVLVPASAVVHEGPDTAVFVVANNKAQRRTVTIGVENSQLTQISHGVKAGEMVITSGQNGLPDGADVAIAQPGAHDEGRDAGAEGGGEKPGAAGK
ncbi:MAG TPA: efflux RND transporter periplasmic adaptor subunit [Vicinamibacterales bacterium]|nr:efflux RND transporter periplasmic adaptor subunit [Vicinamibacterales bacterium]